ncbi:hypothetical protein EF148_17185 [Stenotrophomonas maltophilia]|uniref:Uncharacterized protein n=1 Tax=Stenotrophomonas maltophilia TaxID=40324 RepID=A0AAD0BS72_STEMA|nr:hypothetical protein SmaCSM2_07085 [Stenotrophomonas maltophilia]MBA2131136.1 hypothetical protein [Stenotrophomonas maltophilia]MBH1680966.1 hypothetical protein [Stenotrophomonas maltophilia]MBH1876729.1 hypothetical protein [Stenotrophomonas maltophilia]
MPALIAALLQVTTAPGIDPDRERPSPFPASDSAADIAAKVAEMQAFFDVSQQTARRAVAGAQQYALMERLKARHAARLAGIWVDNAAGWNVVVRLTGPAPAADETHPGADGPQRVRYITGAALTEAEMQHRLHAQQGWFVPQLPELIGYGLDVMTGELELELRDTAGARATVAAVRDHLQAQLGYPVRLRWHPAASHLQSR